MAQATREAQDGLAFVIPEHKPDHIAQDFISPYQIVGKTEPKHAPVEANQKLLKELTLELPSTEMFKDVVDLPKANRSLRHFSRTRTNPRLALQSKASFCPLQDETLKKIGIPETGNSLTLTCKKDETIELCSTGIGVDKLVPEAKDRQSCSIFGSNGHCREKLQRIENCLKFLEQYGIFQVDPYDGPEDEVPAVNPGLVGDGIIELHCKICGRPEDADGTLVCDICEETFHIACCFPKVRSIPRDDRWYCACCTRKRKKRSAELKVYPAGGYLEEKVPEGWKVDKTKVRGWDLKRLERSHARIGPQYQADVPDWQGKPSFDYIPTGYPGSEVARTAEEKLKERETAQQNVLNDIWPLGWIPAKKLPEGEKENWVQCQNVLFEEGDLLSDGSQCQKDILCGKWRRAPLYVIADDGWECSCAILWDPHHSECTVPQELATDEIRKRPKARMQTPMQ